MGTFVQVTIHSFCAHDLLKLLMSCANSGCPSQAYIPTNPQLGSITTGIPTAGGLVTVKGTNLGAYPPAITLFATGTVGIFECTDVTFVKPHTEFT